MNWDKKIVVGIITFLGLTLLVSTQKADAAVNCTPTVYSDPTFTTPVTSLTATANGFANVTDLYIVYTVDPGSTNPQVGQCFSGGDTGTFACPPTTGTSFDVPTQLITVGGTTYAVGTLQGVQFQGFATMGPTAIEFRLSVNGTACASRTSIPIQSFSESCGVSVTPYSDGTNYRMQYSINPGPSATESLITGNSYRVAVDSPAWTDSYVAFTVSSLTSPINLGEWIAKSSLPPNTYRVCVQPEGPSSTCAGAICETTVTVDVNTPACTGSNCTWPSAPPGTNPEESAPPATFSLCKQAADAPTDGADYQACQECFSANKVWTAFGCIGTTKEGIVQDFLRIGMGVSGGFVLISILYGAFLLATSSGDTKRVQEGQEMISSAVMGLLFVIFSIIILQFIGVSLLRIPGFGT